MSALPVPDPERPQPRLRLLEGRDTVLELPRGALGAWILSFAALCASGGHGLFLLVALTRLTRVPSLDELGGPLPAAVVGWFVLSVVLAPAAVFVRGAFTRMAPLRAWTLASLTSAFALTAFALYLRAIALA